MAGSGVVVRTLLMGSDGLVPLDEFGARVEDVDDFNGAIELEINGRRMLSGESWDLIVPLWAYLVGGLAHVARGEPFEVDFPDQPIAVRFIPLGRGARLRVEVDPPGRAAIANTRQFASTMLDAAETFFRHLLRIEIGRKGSYQALLQDIEIARALLSASPRR